MTTDTIQARLPYIPVVQETDMVSAEFVSEAVVSCDEPQELRFIGYIAHTHNGYIGHPVVHPVGSFVDMHV